MRHRRIGLLGGSFNPAHRGHLQLSLTALRSLDIDEVWWLVSPQNPLKPAAGMAPFALRIEQARRVAGNHNRIRVTDLENRVGGSHHTVDTLTALRRRFSRLRFVWLMGSDNLAQIRHWDRWAEIFRIIPIAVFDRPSYSLRALAGLASRRFARQRVPSKAARGLADAKPPAWTFFHSRLDPTSATQLRSERKHHQREIELATVTALNPRIRRQTGRTPPREILGLALKTLDDGKAEDVVTIDLAGKTMIADYMVVASGRTVRQVAALTEHLEQTLAPLARISIEGKAQGDWVLIDAGDVIVQLFRPEIRAYYNIEKLWSEALPDAEAVRQ